MKYRNTKTEVGGIKFDSKREAARYGELRMLERAGVISELRMQVPYVLAPAVKFAGTKRTKPALRYVADFVYQDPTVGQVIEDVKSPATAKLAAFVIKRHLMLALLGREVRVIS